jgi:hypothetical protein
MCRWLAYSGSPILLKEALYGGTHSLVDQSLHSRLGAETTNGDGFGVGWYGAPDTPGVFRSTEPVWNDSNLRELAGRSSDPGAGGVNRTRQSLTSRRRVPVPEPSLQKQDRRTRVRTR